MSKYFGHKRDKSSSSTTGGGISEKADLGKGKEKDDPPPFITKREEAGDAPAYTLSSATRFASLSLHSSDKIRLMGFGSTEIQNIRTTILQNYRFGIQAEKPNYAGSHEFKLHSYPWRGQGKDAIASRVVMRELLACLWKMSWVLMASVDVSKKDWDKDTLLFRFSPQLVEPKPLEWLCISFNEYDKLRLIGAPTALISSVSSLISTQGLLSKEGWKEDGAREFKLKGYPWMSGSEEGMRMRGLLLKLLGVLESQGWTLYSRIDHSEGAGENVGETDTWYVVREVGWVEGMKVWHR